MKGGAVEHLPFHHFWEASDNLTSIFRHLKLETRPHSTLQWLLLQYLICAASNRHKDLSRTSYLQRCWLCANSKSTSRHSCRDLRSMMLIHQLQCFIKIRIAIITQFLDHGRNDSVLLVSILSRVPAVCCESHTLG